MSVCTNHDNDSAQRDHDIENQTHNTQTNNDHDVMTMMLHKDLYNMTSNNAATCSPIKDDTRCIKRYDTV